MTAAPKLAVLVGRWGAPPDDVAWVAFALGLGAVLAVLASRDVLEGIRSQSRARFLIGASMLASFLTLGFAAHYLRGGPRIIDATAYALQAKALAHRELAWHVPWPSASFRGRFLLCTSPDRLAGIFPPGWPLLLSIGYVLGAPMLVGIALAAALVVATYALVLELLHDSPLREDAARLGALLSVACAALRYQTADPMSHAATALAVALAFLLALRIARGASRRRTFVALGFLLGATVCTRPISTLPILVVALLLVRKSRPSDALFAAVATLPGLALLLAAQHAATGSFFASTQQAYYATSDGPPGCFRYGFGAGIGCLHEHGDFVRARLSNGFGLVAAAGTTLRRLHVHLSDALDAWPVTFLALPACVAGARRHRTLRFAWLVVALQILAYAPFYFDGDYPGAGARFFADVLPIEHAAIAVSLALFLPRVAFAKKAALLLGLTAIGFALHGAYDDLSLANRDGGRPMFEPERLQENHVDTGLLFIDTDHGFDLAYDPAVTDPTRGVVVARLRNDSHDRLLYEKLGRPRTWAYRFGAIHDDRLAEPTLLPFTPPSAEVAGRELWRFESEVDWPPISQNGAWAEPAYTSGARQGCPSAGEVLIVHPPGTIRIAIPVPRAAKWTIRPFILARPGDGPVDLALGATHWTSPAPSAATAECRDLGAQTLELGEGEVPLEIRVSSGPVALDRVELSNR
ncbi:MAG TPA: hypothetical protein VGH28_06365 [Polyangiaceae bacterium]|jgi:hypothetical protein